MNFDLETLIEIKKSAGVAIQIGLKKKEDCFSGLF